VITFQSQYDSNQDNIYHSKTVIKMIAFYFHIFSKVIYWWQSWISIFSSHHFRFIQIHSDSSKS